MLNAKIEDIIRSQTSSKWSAAKSNIEPFNTFVYVCVLSLYVSAFFYLNLKSLNNKPLTYESQYTSNFKTVCIVGNLLNTDVSVILSLVLKHLPRESDS